MRIPRIVVLLACLLIIGLFMTANYMHSQQYGAVCHVPTEDSDIARYCDYDHGYWRPKR